ncbi:hypothetical protein [Deinococcus roseus]|uniref:hypothetical protein n=1 Tax=Deinococcus roseus TaxID=392414 RepID=UPI0016698D62|nr:hypothetical protein [Deinococcus roseus]
MNLNLLKRLGRWVKAEPAAPATPSGVQKVTAEDVLARIGNVSPLEAAFIAAMENGEIGPDGDVVLIEEEDG